MKSSYIRYSWSYNGTTAEKKTLLSARDQQVWSIKDMHFDEC
jgi:hypothetical protein